MITRYTTQRFLAAWVTGLVLGAGPAWAADDAPATAPAAAPAASESAAPADAKALAATVVKVTGTVKYANIGVEPDDFAAWQKVTPDMVLPSGTQIMTSVRSEAVLRFADDTVALVEPASLMGLMDLYQTTDQDRVRLGLGYGAVRAGSAEKGKKVKLTIETNNLVLSKEGTQGIRLQYNAGNGHFTVSLTRSGLVRVTNTLTGRSLDISPNEFVTQAMIRWIETQPFLTSAQVSDAFALSPNENLFSKQGGIAIASPGGGPDNGANPVNTSGGQQNVSALQRLSEFALGSSEESNILGSVSVNLNNFFGPNSGVGLPVGPGFNNASTTTGQIFIPQDNGSGQPSNVQLIIAFIRANPQLVEPYGVTVDQVVTYIEANPQVVSNITVADIIRYTQTGQLPAGFSAPTAQAQQRIAAALKARWQGPRLRTVAGNRAAVRTQQDWRVAIRKLQSAWTVRPQAAVRSPSPRIKPGQ